MLTRLIISSVVVAFFLSGCASSSTNYTTGREFNQESTNFIIKGKTTTSELISQLGQPQFKSVISETDEKWVYSYTKGSASAQVFFMQSKVNSSGIHRMLDVLVRNNTVVNFAYTENQLPGYTTSTTR